MGRSEVCQMSLVVKFHIWVTKTAVAMARFLSVTSSALHGPFKKIRVTRLP